MRHRTITLAASSLLMSLTSISASLYSIHNNGTLWIQIMMCFCFVIASVTLINAIRLLWRFHLSKSQRRKLRDIFRDTNPDESLMENQL